MFRIEFSHYNGTVIDLQGKVLSFPDKQLKVNVLSRGETTGKYTIQITIPSKCIHTVSINLNLMGAWCIKTHNKDKSHVQVVNPTQKSINIPRNLSIGLASPVTRRNALSLQ